MKKTLTVNLNGIVYHIDEDAYELLSVYLDNLRQHFSKTPGSHEILMDMESRISEIFNEYLTTAGQVITISHVEQLIARLGKPEELATDTVEETTDKDTRHQTEERVSSGSAQQKRLFRDTVEKMLGGVCAGIAAYLDVAPLWIRIGFILLALFTKLLPMLAIYGVLWVLIPEAHSATDRLKMKGNPINMETIGQTVSDTFHKVSQEIKPQTLFERILQGITTLAVFCVKAILILIGICLLPLAFIVLFIAVVFFLSAAGILISIPTWIASSINYIDWTQIGQHPAYTFSLIFCWILIVGIPVYALVVSLLQVFGSKVRVSSGWKIFLFLLWSVVLIIGTALVCTAPFFIPSGWDGTLIEI